MVVDRNGPPIPINHREAPSASALHAIDLLCHVSKSTNMAANTVDKVWDQQQVEERGESVLIEREKLSRRLKQGKR